MGNSSGIQKKDVKKMSKRELEERDKIILKEIVTRQLKAEKAEIVQTWNFVFGDELPEKKKEIIQIPEVTIRKIWMEPLFLYNEIKKFRPNEKFHEPELYALKWQPPGINLRLMIPLDDQEIQEQVVLQISQMSSGERKKLLFHFAPKNVTGFPLLKTNVVFLLKVLYNGPVVELNPK